MADLYTIIYESHADIPETECGNFFHGKALFRVFESTPRMKPYMVCVSAEGKKVVSCLLGVVRSRGALFPPFLCNHCLVLGEGEYFYHDYSREKLFKMMLAALTRRVQNQVLYIEFCQLGDKMFGYGSFRSMGYFPVHWQNVRNSLHSKLPEDRIAPRMWTRIVRALGRGVTVNAVDNEAGVLAFAHLIKRHNLLKPKRYIPDVTFFRQMAQCGAGKLFLIKHKERLIGCSMCVLSGNNAYLWYMASRRKTFALLHPDALTVWAVLKYAYRKGCDHVSFVDIGLPLFKNRYRDFILQFGGKPVSTYRWLRFSIKWLNGTVAWMFGD